MPADGAAQEPSDTAARLEASERRFAAALELTGLAWWEYDVASDTHRWSDRMWELVGLSPQPVAPTLAQFRALMHPDDAGRPHQVTDSPRPEAGTSFDLFRVRHPDGSTRVLQSWTEQTLTQDGQVGSVFGVTLDVTEREAAARLLEGAEQQFRLAFDSAPIGMVMLDLAPGAGGRVLRANAAMLRMLGLDGQDVSATRAGSWLHPDDRVEGERRFRGLLAGQGDALEFGARCAHSSGGTIHVWVSASVVREDDGSPMHLLIHVLDVTERHVAAEQLRDRERRLADAQALVGLAWWEWDRTTDVLTWSDGMYALTGRPVGTPMTGADWQAMLHPEDRDEAVAYDARAVEDAAPHRHVFRILRPDGQVRHLEAWTTPVADDEGVVRRFRGATLDVTARERASRAVARSEERFRVAFDEGPIGMTLTAVRDEPGGARLRVNDAFCELVGHDAATVLRLGEPGLTHPQDLAAHEAAARRLARGEVDALAYEKRYVHAQGHAVHVWVHSAVVHDEGGRPSVVVTHALDVSDRVEQQRQLQRLALADTLTGLGNRTLFEDRMQHALAALGRTPGRVALLLLDLDRFKLVNDSLGHQVGDALLVEVARRLQSATRADTTVARLGGDEFVVLMERAEDDDEVATAAERLLDVLRAPYVLPSGDTVVTTISLGISMTADPRAVADELFREADLALYQAKDAGRDRIAAFGADLRSRALLRVSTEQRLRRGLAEGGLRMHLQPVVRLLDRQTVLAEALVRLEDPEVGLVPPMDFIGVAEDSGLITQVDAWVLDSAVRALADPACPYPRIAVNVSGRTLEEPGMADRVARTLERWGVDGTRLVVELTESTLLDGRPATNEGIRALQALQVEVGIDDFGTGWSALSYLARFDLDFLKIDRSFVAKLGDGPQPRAVVAAIVDLAHAHSMTVTAEGVETASQARLLTDMGCDHAQGWLFGRPATWDRTDPGRQPGE